MLTGLLGVFCSVMVYVFTQRPFWSFRHTGTRFGLTLLAAGSCFVAPLLAVFAIAGKIGYERWIRDEKRSPFPESARVINGPLKRIRQKRVFHGVVAAGFLLASIWLPFLAVPGFVNVILAELQARKLYFQAVKEPGMPGGIVAP